MKNNKVFRDLICRLRNTFLLFCTLFVFDSRAQTLPGTRFVKIINYSVLPESGYSLNDVRSQKHNSFHTQSMQPSKTDAYWIKLNIYNPYPNNELYVFALSQQINYKLYHFDAISNAWVSQSVGLNAYTGIRMHGKVPVTLAAKALNTFYLRVDVQDLRSYNVNLNPALVFEKKLSYDTNEQMVVAAYIICCFILFSFALYNLYLFYIFKDKAYLYYVVVQVGAIIYLTADKLIMNIFLPLKVYNMYADGIGRVYYMDINLFFEHIGVVIMLCGFVRFTQTFLNTRVAAPLYHKLLNIHFYVYIIIEVIPCLIIISGLYFLQITPLVNIYILIMVASCVAAAIAIYRKGQRIAKYFLSAYLLPMIFTSGAALYNIVYNAGSPYLPEAAIISQIFTLAIALVARVKIINEELRKKDIEAVQLAADVKLAEYQRLLAEEENKTINLTIALEKEHNQLLKQQLESNQRELMGNSLHLQQKNRLLADLTEKVHKMDAGTLYANNEALKSIQSTLKDGRYLDDEWDKFKLHFEQVHPDFFKSLLKQHPNLTKYELRLYAYFHINLSTKEIAAMLNIAPSSVRQAKARLNKKMNSR
ncbi:7TM diverse intracellular signaling domain-containing protein [Mucilaginibacter hurinus]|nr:7TM diverse intracellular signaling domain-containing protein [Mucilaginibacter hurinus]